VHPVITRSLPVILALAAGFISARGADQEKAPDAACAQGACAWKALKGVVHLSDNDIRFARKGGGLVLVDPLAGPADAAAVRTGLVKPDLILITHPHGDHFQPAVLQAYRQANPQVVIAGPAEVVKLAQEQGIAGVQTVVPNQSYTLAGFEFSTVPAYFDDPKWNHPQAGGWVGYVIPLNGVRYYVTGDTQPLPEMAAVKADVILPLLSGCGGNLPQALKMAALSGARVVVPVHHGGRTETIRKFAAQLPPDVQSFCFLDGKLVPAAKAGVTEEKPAM